MSSTVPWSVYSRRITLAVIGVASVGAAVGVQFAPSGLLDIRSASTPQLVGILALLLLPLTTVVAIMVDRRLWLRRWRGRARTPVLSAPLPIPAGLATIRQPVATIVPEAAPAGVEKPSAIVHGAAPRSPAIPAAPRTPSPRPQGPRIEVVVESKPVRHQVLTVYAVPRNAPPRNKSAA